MSVNDLIFNSGMSGLDDALDSGSDSGVSSVVDAASAVGNTAIVSGDVAQSIATKASDTERHYGDNEHDQGDDSEEDDGEDDDDSFQNILRLAGVETRGPSDPPTRTAAGQKRSPVKPASTATSAAQPDTKPAPKGPKQTAHTATPKR